MRQQILTYLDKNKFAKTEEIVEALGLPHEIVQARVSEYAAAGNNYRIPLFVDGETAETIEQIARAENKSESAVCRELLAVGLKAKKKGKE